MRANLARTLATLSARNTLCHWRHRSYLRSITTLHNPEAELICWVFCNTIAKRQAVSRAIANQPGWLVVPTTCPSRILFVQEAHGSDAVCRSLTRPYLFVSRTRDMCPLHRFK